MSIVRIPDCMAWNHWFPFPTFRPYQEETLEKIINAYDSGKRFVVLEAVCGSGKSSYSLALSRYYGSAYIATPEKHLQKQYYKDFSDFLTLIQGKSNYPCTYNWETGECQFTKKENLDTKIFNLANEIVKSKDYKTIADLVRITQEAQEEAKKILKDETPPSDEEETVDDYSNITAMYSCDNAPCGLNIGKKKKSAPFTKCTKKGSCIYLNKRNAAIDAPITLLNFSNLLHFFNILNMFPWIQHWFQPRDILILDEGHNIEKKLYSFAEIGLTPRGFKPMLIHLTLEQNEQLKRGFDTVEEATLFCKEVFPVLEKVVENLELKADREKDEDYDGKPKKRKKKKESKENDIEDIGDDLIKLRRLYDKINDFLLDVETRPYVIRKAFKGGGSVLCPLTVEHLHNLAFCAGERVLIMSATIIDIDTFCRSLGIPKEETEYIQIPTTFPVENRPFHYAPVGKMSRDSMLITLPKMVKDIEETMEEFSKYKGLIHTYNYKIAKYLQENLKSPRLLIQTPDTNKDRLVREHFESDKPSILCGPGFSEGLDLKYNLCRFIYFCKMPYLDMTDPVVAARMKIDPKWYALMTVINLMQMKGRGERAEDDWCIHKMGDSCFGTFYYYNKNLLIGDFLNTLKWEA